MARCQQPSVQTSQASTPSLVPLCADMLMLCGDTRPHRSAGCLPGS